MAQRKSKPKSKPKAPKNADGRKADAPTDHSDGILIQYVGDQTQIAPLGAIKQTELPTRLRQAAKVADQALGID